MRSLVVLVLMWVVGILLFAHVVVIPAERAYAAIFAPITEALSR